MLLLPTNKSARESIFQRKTHPSMQGRVFALSQSISRAAFPIAALVAGPLADLVDASLKHDHAGILRRLAGFIPSSAKGAAVMFMLLGGINIASALVGFMYKPLRSIDTLMKDWDADVKKK